MDNFSFHVDEARLVVDRVAELLRGAGVPVKTFHDNTSRSVDQNLSTIVNYHNAQSRDLDVSARFGLPLPIGDTVGPAGISRALRNVPVLVDVARAMEQRCPDAWMLNVTNPLTALTRAVTRETAIKAVGLCHEVQNCRFFLSQMLDANYADLALRVTGVNHLPLIVLNIHRPGAIAAAVRGERVGTLVR